MVEFLRSLGTLFWCLLGLIVLLILLPWLWVKAADREAALYEEYRKGGRPPAEDPDLTDCAP